MSLDPEALPPKGDTAEKIAFTGKAEPYPTINGSNLFTGEFTGKSAIVGLVATDQAGWEQAWAAIGKKPPGPLPENAQAVIEGIKKTVRDPAVSYVLLGVDIKPNSEIHIDWKRVNIAKSEDKDAKSRYAVLLLPPKGKLKAAFTEVWPHRERQKKFDEFDENIKSFKTGANKPLPAPSKAQFKRKPRPALRIRSQAFRQAR